MAPGALARRELARSALERCAGRRGRALAQGAASSSKADQRAQKVIDSVAACTLDQATTHPKWQAPPADRAGIQKFLSTADQRLRKLGDLIIAKQAAGDSTEEQLREIAYQKLVTRRPNDQLQVLSKRRKAVKLEVIALEAKSNELRDDLKAKQQELRQLESNVADVRAVLADGGAADDEGDWDTDGFGLAPSWDAFHKAVIDRRLNSEAPGDGLPAWPSGVVGQSPRPRASSAGSATRGFADQVAKANAERAHQQQRHAEAEQEFAAELAEVRRIKRQQYEQLEFAAQMEARIISHDTAFTHAKAEAEAATHRAIHLHEQLEQVRAEHLEKPQPQDGAYQDLMRARAEAQESLRRAQHESAQATAAAGNLKQQLARQELVMEEKLQEAKKNHALEIEAAAEAARAQAIDQAQVVANAKGKGALPPAEAARLQGIVQTAARQQERLKQTKNELEAAEARIHELQQYSKLEAGAAQRAAQVAYHEAAELRSANKERQVPHEVQALQFALLRTRAEEEEIAKASLKDKEAMRAELEGSVEGIRASLTRQVMIEEANAHDLQLHTESLRQELSSYAVQLSEQKSNAEVQEQALEEELAQALTFRIASMEEASAMEDFASQQRTGREEAIHLALHESLQRSSMLHTELDAIAKKEQQGASETEELKLRMQSLEAIAASRERERKAMVNLYAEMRQYGQEGYDFTKRAAHHLVQGGHLPTSQESMDDYQEAADLYEEARGAAEAAAATRDRSRSPDRPDPHEEAERYEREQDELHRQAAEEKAQWEAVQMEEELESVVRDHEAKEIQRRYYEEAPLTQFGTAGTQDSRVEDDGSEHAPMIYPARWPPWSQDHPTPDESDEMRGITQHEADTDLASTSRASSIPAEQGDPPTPTASQVILIPASPAPLSEMSLTPTVPFGHEEQRQNAEAAGASIERQYEGIDIMTRQHTSAAAAAAALEEAFGPVPAFPGEDISQAHKGQRIENVERTFLDGQSSAGSEAEDGMEQCYENWRQARAVAAFRTAQRSARRARRAAESHSRRDNSSSHNRYHDLAVDPHPSGSAAQPAAPVPPEPVAETLRGRGRVNVCDDVDTTTLHSMARLALEMCPSRELPTRRTHIYTDGSYNGIPHSAAWAVVIVDEYEDGSNLRGPFSFRGSIAGKVTETLDDMVNNEKVTAYTAELTAVLWALMWALGQDTDAPIEITPDALNVINLAKDQASASDLMDPNIAAVQAIAHNKFLSWEWLRSAPDAVKAAYPPLRHKDFIIEATQPQAAPGAIQRPISTITIKADLNVNLCTYNCRSLKATVSFKPGKGKAAGKSKQSLSKATHLAAQFADMGLHVIALQETQSEGDVRNVGEYVCYSSGHMQQNRGCDIWLNVSQPISTSGAAKYLSAKDTLVLHQHDRLLIIKTRVAGTDMVIASAYAPHEDSHAAEKREFWESAKRLSDKYRVDIFMGDLNGRLGDYESPGVGTSGYPEVTNGNGKHIISFAADTNMEVINTTRDPGSNSYTHVGSKGQRHRIDYILLNSSIAPYVASCSTEPGLDRGTAAQDHIPVLASLKWAVCKTTKASGPKPDLTNLNNDVAKASFKKILKQAPIIPWEVDVNTHCEEATRVINDAAIQAFGKASRATRKPYVTKTTMGLIRARSGPIVAAAVEKDRSAFLSRLASTASSASAANDAAAQWKAYRDLLRYGGRKAKFPAGKPMRLDNDGEVIHNSQEMADQELNHFAKIQAGKIVTADDLADKYNHDSKTRPFDGMLDLSMVMPLAVCQAQFAAAKAGTQGGPDGLTNAVLRAAPTEAARLLHPLFTKVATTVREPLSFKGGDLVAIPKGKGDPRYLQAYREILLNNVLGKHHHKYLRTMLNTTLAIALEDIQVGGRPKRGADMAVLAARLFTERSQAQGKCSMISCYDLKEAFYSVVVQLVHGIPGEEDEVQEVLENLEVPLWAQPQLEHLMANPGILDTVLDGSHLAALIAEGYRNRWTSHRFSQNLMAPHKGTRPGVPLADADFNLLFGRVHRMIDNYLAQRGENAEADGIAELLALGAIAEADGTMELLALGTMELLALGAITEVEIVRQITEALVWGEQNDSSLFDFFCEKSILADFIRVLSLAQAPKTVKVQLLQTLSMLVQNIRRETSLYYILSANYVNRLIELPLDFSNEEILAYYITLLKSLAMRLNDETVKFFFVQHPDQPEPRFPLYIEATKLSGHKDQMVRATVRTITLQVYPIKYEPMRRFVLRHASESYFEGLAYHLIELWYRLDAAAFGLRPGILLGPRAAPRVLAHHASAVHAGAGVPPWKAKLSGTGKVLQEDDDATKRTKIQAHTVQYESVFQGSPGDDSDAVKVAANDKLGQLREQARGKSKRDQLPAKGAEIATLEVEFKRTASLVGPSPSPESGKVNPSYDVKDEDVEDDELQSLLSPTLWGKLQCFLKSKFEAATAAGGGGESSKRSFDDLSVEENKELFEAGKGGGCSAFTDRIRELAKKLWTRQRQQHFQQTGVCIVL
ncbi:unnamed protein product [Prorocentrum cordatum]|uniref:RNase H type-1 domain-containing protein n=1 Tax=Prorocentrum cordatum TaxID=2364126 RepID=A0ABN9ULD0_9DINO|nr:unnamed protein product [Polarella glacialis]